VDLGAKLLTEARWSRITLDAAAYNATMLCLGWVQALELLWEMRLSLIKPNSRTYNCAIGTCARGWQWEAALALLVDVRRNSLGPNAFTYGVAVSACEKGSAWMRALELLLEARHCCAAPDFDAHGAEQSAFQKDLAKERTWTSTVQLHAIMGWSDVTSAVTRSMALDEYQHSPVWADALGMPQRMHHRNRKSNVGTCSSGVNVCEMGQGWNWMLELLDKIQRDRINSAIIMLTAVITACERGHKWQLALHLLDGACRFKLAFDPELHAAAIRASEKSGHLHAPSLMCYMRCAGVHSFHVVAMLDMCVQAALPSLWIRCFKGAEWYVQARLPARPFSADFGGRPLCEKMDSLAHHHRDGKRGDCSGAGSKSALLQSSFLLGDPWLRIIGDLGSSFARHLFDVAGSDGLGTIKVRTAFASQ